MRSSCDRGKVSALVDGVAGVSFASIPGMVSFTSVYSSSRGGGGAGCSTAPPTVTSLSSGLTPTTPTVTPTQLCDLSRSHMAYDDALAAPPVSHAGQACFVTPHIVSHHNFPAVHTPVIASPTGAPHWSRAVTTRSVSGGMSGGISVVQPAAAGASSGHRRGGRRPKEQDMALSPEEEERRQLRRERNKQAAARCRRRRLELTHSLQMETDQLVQERSRLERELQVLNGQYGELHYIVESHRRECKLRVDRFHVEHSQAMPPPDTIMTIKPEPETLSHDLVQPQSSGAPLLTTSLNAPHTVAESMFDCSEAASRRPSSLVLHGVDPLVPGSLVATPPLTTMGFSFDSLVESTANGNFATGTGALTPVTSVLSSITSSSVLMTPICPERPTADLRSPDSSDKHLVSL